MSRRWIYCWIESWLFHSVELGQCENWSCHRQHTSLAGNLAPVKEREGHYWWETVGWQLFRPLVLNQVVWSQVYKSFVIAVSMRICKYVNMWIYVNCESKRHGHVATIIHDNEPGYQIIRIIPRKTNRCPKILVIIYQATAASPKLLLFFAPREYSF